MLRPAGEVGRAAAVRTLPGAVLTASWVLMLSLRVASRAASSCTCCAAYERGSVVAAAAMVAFFSAASVAFAWSLRLARAAFLAVSATLPR